MSLLSNLAENVNSEFKDVLPALNAVIADMASDYLTWQSNPVVKATEAVTTLVNPVAAIDMQAVIGAASLVQALWQVFGPAAPVVAATPTPIPAVSVVLNEGPTTLQSQIAAAGNQIPDAQPSHM